MPMLDRAGTNLYYEVTGPQTDRVPLLLTHGYSSSAAMWTGNLPALSRDRQVVTWDIRGHGRSDSPDDPAQYSEAISVDDMAAFLDLIGAERAVVGGLSLGGYLSLAFHLRFPDRVTALVVCDAGPGYRRDEARAKWNTETVDRYATQFEQRGLDALGTSPEIVASQQRNPLGLARAARGILAQHDSRVFDSLPTISVPTLIVVGANDTPFLAAADVMEAKIPGARKAVLADAGHASNVDQPAAFDRAVTAFLEKL